MDTNGISIINQDCETVIAELGSLLFAHGLHVVRSFDLQSASAVDINYSCPHHGEAPCDCQMVVLLVYGDEEIPASVLLHSHRKVTRIEINDSPNNHPGNKLLQLIHGAFEAIGQYPMKNNPAW